MGSTAGGLVGTGDVNIDDVVAAMNLIVGDDSAGLAADNLFPFSGGIHLQAGDIVVLLDSLQNVVGSNGLTNSEAIDIDGMVNSIGLIGVNSGHDQLLGGVQVDDSIILAGNGQGSGYSEDSLGILLVIDVSGPVITGRNLGTDAAFIVGDNLVDMFATGQTGDGIQQNRAGLDLAGVQVSPDVQDSIVGGVLVVGAASAVLSALLEQQTASALVLAGMAQVQSAVVGGAGNGMLAVMILQLGAAGDSAGDVMQAGVTVVAVTAGLGTLLGGTASCMVARLGSAATGIELGAVGGVATGFGSTATGIELSATICVTGLCSTAASLVGGAVASVLAVGFIAAAAVIDQSAAGGMQFVSLLRAATAIQIGAGAVIDGVAFLVAVSAELLALTIS